MGKALPHLPAGGSTNVGIGFEIRSIFSDLSDHSSLLWLRRSTIGRWRSKTNLCCIQEEARVAGLDMSTTMVGNAYALISFNSSTFRDCALANTPGWFFKWFLGVELWESLDLVSSNVCQVSLKDIPLSYEHNHFFHLLAHNLGILLRFLLPF